MRSHAFADELQAFDGAEDKLTRLVDYTLRCCVGYIDRALESPGLRLKIVDEYLRGKQVVSG